MVTKDDIPFSSEWFSKLEQLPKWRQFYTMGDGNQGLGFDYVGPEYKPKNLDEYLYDMDNSI